jgi:hypothetical protein
LSEPFELEQIVYISTARTRPDEAMLESILSTSRRNNRRDGLTGLLLVGGRRFLQVLEGPQESCRAAYDRIRFDDRHFALVELSRKPVTERAFGAWDMGFESAGEDRLPELVQRLAGQVRDPVLRAQFLSFAELHGTAA